MKRLIISADDLNLTPGVSEAILDAHERGVVTSASLLINRPVSRALLRRVESATALGIGLHLNVTLGEPVAPKSEVASLLQASGRFKRVPEYLASPPMADELRREWEAQVRRFLLLLGRYPTHLDTHHQLHDRPLFFRVFCELSRRYFLPVRRSLRMRGFQDPRGYRTTDFFFGDLDPQNPWRKEKFLRCLDALPDGLSEIMTHPGKNDPRLEHLSSFTRAREEEWRLLTSREVRERIRDQGIELTHFGLCYT